MSIEIGRFRRGHRRTCAAAPARPAPPPPRPIESFKPPAPRCPWPRGCKNPEDIWYGYRYCPTHAAIENEAREARLRGYTDTLDLLLVECLLKVQHSKDRVEARRMAQDAQSHSDQGHTTPGGMA